MNPFKINKNKEPLTDNEIEKQMNFDKFIAAHTPGKVWLPKGMKLFLFSASVVAVIVVASFVIYSSGKKQVTSSQRPFIVPPIKSMDLPSDNFAVNNANDTIITYKTGTQIKIPATAFADKDGNDIKGVVHIVYREFHDPIDIVLSGIPMNYDSAGTHYQLESAGMFGVMAYQNDKQLFLKPGKELSINMISHTNNPNDYNVYYLDTVKRKWDYISENTNQNNTCIPIFDRNPEFDKVFKANEDFVKVNKPVLPKKEDANQYNFVIDFKKDEFPELAVYSGLKFEPTEGKKKFHEALAQKTWENVLIERQNDNEHYKVTFSTEKESQSINVVPVVNEKNYEATLKEYEKKQKLYEATLVKRKKEMKTKRDSLYRIKNIFVLNAKKSDLNSRFNSFIDNNYIETSKDLLAYRTLAINKLGIWNSDQPYKFFSATTKEKSNEHIAEFVTESNEPLPLLNVYLIKHDVNSFYPVPEQRFQHFPFDKSIDVLVGFGYENEVYYITREKLDGIDNNKEALRFKMTKVGAGITNAEQLKNLLKI